MLPSCARLGIIFLLLLLAGCARAPTPLPANRQGVHLLLDDGRNAWPQTLWATHLDHAREVIGVDGYVTELVRLDDLDPVRWQHFMDLCAERDLIPILRLATTFEREKNWWNAPEPDHTGRYHDIAAQYATFVAALRWPTSNHYIVVGNEPNHGNEWSGHPDPPAYARFLIDVADALHAADPAAHVLNAGLDPYTPHSGTLPLADGMFYIDAETFLDEMYAAHPDVFERLDLWSSHPYPGGPMSAAPWEQVFGREMLNGATNPRHLEPPPGVVNRGVNGYEWELFKLSTYGAPPLPVMITETGWRHAESSDPAATDTGQALPDAATVAMYLDLALHGNEGRYPELPEEGWQPWLSDPRVVAVTPFAFNGHPAEWGHTNWLILDAAGTVQSRYPMVDVLR
ncbi:MAG: hypothetical protein H0T73_23980 [Ardenticatenales bacterium]|nr:hypothetical protein [Ardenticatenales bacterium]